jgi:hypothetical protein
MTDALLDRLAQANPVPAAVVAELSAQLRRQRLELPPVATERANRRRALVIAVLLAIVALIAAPALALRFGVIDFSHAEPASPRVVKQFFSLSEGAPKGMDPQAIPGETRLVGEIGGHTLWVAPTKPGGLCYEWSQASGGCEALGTVPLSVSWASDEAPDPTSRGSFEGVDGFVRTRWADDVEIKLDDGSTVHPQMLWISPPINAGFFFYQAPKGRTIESVLALKNDKVMTADTSGTGAPPGPHPFADLSKRKEQARIETADGVATLWVAPTATEGRCTWLQFRNEEIAVVPCLPKGYEHQAALVVAVHAIAGHLILAGECGYSAIEFLHPDGSSRRSACADGLVFTELNPADQAGQMRALDAKGDPLPGSTGPVPKPITGRP